MRYYCRGGHQGIELFLETGGGEGPGLIGIAATERRGEGGEGGRKDLNEGALPEVLLAMTL